ncbi:MAG: BlaI/MecI/CopY family transcriptional regulator [Lachnospiraceae bacterium]|nr:BlaI/MecI/CopY family transcriptional regulator [Lachnospiraceae bacterium]
MKEIELGAVQERFADIVWAHEPIGSGELVKLCEKELQWKKPTTYTVLRKLCEKGLLRNQDGVVTSLISREAFYSAKTEQIIEDSFDGSLPAFIAAFISKKRLTAEEADEIRQMIDAFKSDTYKREGRE